MDAYISKLAFIYAFEFKELNRGHLEAETQLITLYTAMLLKLEDLIYNTGVITKILALIGWVIVGHNQFYYISTICPNNSIIYIYKQFSRLNSNVINFETFTVDNLYNQLLWEPIAKYEVKATMFKASLDKAPRKDCLPAKVWREL